MGYEVEQKFRCDRHDPIIERLAGLGATPGGPVEQVDAYLNHPVRDFAVSGESMRLRRVGERNMFTYKGPKLAGPTKTRPEYEVAFEPGAEAYTSAHHVMISLGFRPVAEVRKTRTPYHLTYQDRALEVVLDVVEGLGRFVEVETLAAGESDLPGAQAAVLSLSRELGLSDLETRSYLRLLLELRAAGADS